MSLNIILSGASGRMGTIIQELIAEQPSVYQISATISRQDSEQDIMQALAKGGVLVDFSHPKQLNRLLSILLAQHQSIAEPLSILTGTTGFQNTEQKLIDQAGQLYPIMQASNTSLGATIIKQMAARLSVILPGYDINILEAHHRNKIDSPSGTSLSIEAAIRQADRPRAINHATIRGGGIIGEHTVIFAGDQEVISVKHQALTRKAFAQGALVAANWLYNKPIGSYKIDQIFNL